MNSISIIPKIVPQILGFNEEAISIKISILLDKNLIIKPNSILIVKVSLTFSSKDSPIIITQELSSDKIVESNDPNYNSLSLDGTLWINGKANALQLIDSNCTIYYISND